MIISNSISRQVIYRTTQRYYQSLISSSFHKVLTPVVLQNSRAELNTLSSLQTKSSAHQYSTHVVNALQYYDGFAEIVGESCVSSSRSVREQHGQDEGPFRGVAPDLVVWPQSTQEVSRVAKLCNKLSIPMIPYGTGTGLEAGLSALQGGICIDLQKMDQVTAFHPEDFDITVQPGVTRKALNQHIKDQGLWFPIDPGADASVCGMAATSASGTNAVRYGTMRENTMNLEVVLADGRILHTAGEHRRTKKSSAGYNLTNLFVGSEGTLGIITKATVRLYGIPETMVSAVCAFPSIAAAVETTIQTMQSGIPVARIELVDEVGIEACNKYSKLGYPVCPMLFLEFHGSPSEVESQARAVESIAHDNSGSDFKWTENAEDRSKLWKARHDLFYATLALKPGLRAVITDVCVPISRLAEVVLATQQDIRQAGITASILGHVGDGNFHSIILFDPEKSGDLQSAKGIASNIAKRALDVNGTCTGEHGIGVGKMQFLNHEFGPVGLSVMREMKRALDPKNIMNPGKVVDMD